MIYLINEQIYFDTNIQRAKEMCEEFEEWRKRKWARWFTPEFSEMTQRYYLARTRGFMKRWGRGRK